MCPLCIGSAVMVASSVMSTGGLTALVAKTFGGAETGAKTPGGSINKPSGKNGREKWNAQKSYPPRNGLRLASHIGEKKRSSRTRARN